MGTCRPLPEILSNGSGLGRLRNRRFQTLAELLVQFFILQISKAFARNHHDIQASQLLLVMAEGFTEKAFEAVALDGELDVLLADHQAQTGVIETVFARQQQDVACRNLGGGGVEDCCELPGLSEDAYPG